MGKTKDTLREIYEDAIETLELWDAYTDDGESYSDGLRQQAEITLGIIEQNLGLPHYFYKDVDSCGD